MSFLASKAYDTSSKLLKVVDDSTNKVTDAALNRLSKVTDDTTSLINPPDENPITNEDNNKAPDTNEDNNKAPVTSNTERGGKKSKYRRSKKRGKGKTSRCTPPKGSRKQKKQTKRIRHKRRQRK
jgi:hypothetical protein